MFLKTPGRAYAQSRRFRKGQIRSPANYPVRSEHRRRQLAPGHHRPGRLRSSPGSPCPRRWRSSPSAAARSPTWARVRCSTTTSTATTAPSSPATAGTSTTPSASATAGTAALALRLPRGHDRKLQPGALDIPRGNQLKGRSIPASAAGMPVFASDPPRPVR